MKSFRIFILIIAPLTGSFLFLPSSAQSFTDTHKLYYQLNEPSACPAPCRFTTTTVFRFAGDTLVDTTRYRKILSLKDSLSTWQLIGFARETKEGKVYLRRLYQSGNTSDEGLAYDFSLSPGDTMFFYNPFFISDYRDTVVLLRLDTLEIFDSSRKVLYLQSLANIRDSCNWSERWIEGIGSLTGPLLSGFGFKPLTGSYNTLLCVYYGGQLIYSDTNFDKCYYNTTDVPQLTGGGITVTVSPNPVSGISRLQVTGPPGDYLLEIFSPRGRLQMKQLVRNGEPVIIRSADYLPGLYFYRLTKKDLPPLSGKFMVIRK